MTDHNKFQNIIKNVFNKVSTFKNTPWYNETNIKSKKEIDIKDINVQQSPQIPDWNDSSDNSLFNLGSDDFASYDFAELHTIIDGTYTKNGTKSPGVYLDSSGTVALFVRLKLVALSDPDICSNSISYTAYSRDSSENLLLENAYQFNYNSQINVNSSIPVFKPYNYTLEYSSNNSSFTTVDHSIGNWIFDNETGIITFEDNPTTINLSSGSLYFTFVKYIGVQGLENLLYYKNGKIGIGNKDPQSELDVSGSVDITGNLIIGGKLTVDSSVLVVDNSCVGINTNNPQSELDVSGSVNITGDVNIERGIGPGFFPIGAIIMWPTYNFPDGYGTWLLCDGSDNILADDYQDLSNVLGSSGGYITIPNFQDNYVKMSDSNTSNYFSISGENISYYTLEEKDLPDHSHTSNHTHDITDIGHVHQTKEHHHDINDNGHVHQTKAHSHNISDSGHDHTISTHTHDISDSGHTHDIAQHTHEINRSSNGHTHTVPRYNLYFDQLTETSGGGGGTAMPVDGIYFTYNVSNQTANTDPEYTVSSVSQDSGSGDYGVSLAENTSNTSSVVSLTFDVSDVVVGGTDTSGPSVSEITVGRNSDGNTTNASYNFSVDQFTGTDTLESTIPTSTYQDLSLDISGLPHTTAFFFIRAK